MLLAGCQEKTADPKSKQVYTGPILETTNVTTLFSDSARLQVKLQAPLEQQFDNGDLVYPNGVTATFFEKDGTTVVNTLRGKYGRYTRSTNLYVVRGDVRVRNEVKQQSLETEELFYDRAKAKIYTQPQESVRVQTPTELLTGLGLEANEDFSRYRIFKPTGVFTVDQPLGE
ncbi:LPS export ABC transporter periplasmic protein LptC [Hymenobacter busanensis]|uniref:LPS export ABC transporter periplasmic protein LptC n=2 Tax=Hymenobacter busanensis TaxID=2607656 RepID=A0A7L4ZZM7_9BACT|nr:LPS export ABC transporter periplasmic protein LptC [Hymenobacter busanensis]KAA9332933.1 LPS export ABC transporter periplasmic protein LptC [Hymenobacter busanensis]QHJ08393.1 LPS export ABC transporter periplasmic protein LptC [Hymenobacter busanensis]